MILMQALHRTRIPRSLTALLALLAGLGLAMGFAPWGLWPLTITGVGLLTWLVADSTPRVGFAVGMLAGCALYGTTIWWGRWSGCWSW